jgi:hypothetical protein
MGTLWAFESFLLRAMRASPATVSSRATAVGEGLPQRITMDVFNSERVDHPFHSTGNIA